ncbi:MAG TPA: hypothetical protein VGP15_13310, partial [Burkholderiales bacterium]|nr:hypothetical protein [Burkholderiales bacterium]
MASARSTVAIKISGAHRQFNGCTNTLPELAIRTKGGLSRSYAQRALRRMNPAGRREERACVLSG